VIDERDALVLVCAVAMREKRESASVCRRPRS
jgi:hypothetical protein